MLAFVSAAVTRPPCVCSRRVLACSLRRNNCAISAVRSGTFVSSTAFRDSTAWHRPRNPSRSVNCSAEPEPQGASEEQREKKFVSKFDPTSETDAFGRDPRKETEFWMGAARSVLDSEEVKQAIEEHAADGGDGLTDEQRAYMEFLKSLDGDSKKDNE